MTHIVSSGKLDINQRNTESKVSRSGGSTEGMWTTGNKVAIHWKIGVILQLTDLLKTHKDIDWKYEFWERF